MALVPMMMSLVTGCASWKPTPVFQDLPAHAVPAWQASDAALQSALTTHWRDGGPFGGMVLGLSTLGAAPRFYGVGSRGAVGGDPPDADTLFEIGSLTKTFTATLLMEAVHRGEVSLDTPLRALYPELPPDAWVGDITLGALATHRSGLPKVPSLWRHVVDALHPAHFLNPYAGIDRARLLRELRALTDDEAAHHRWQRGQPLYSNYGYALLGDALATRLGQSYAALLQTRLLDPCGLHDIWLSAPDAWPASAQGRLAHGRRWQTWLPEPAWRADAYLPAAFLRASAAGVLRYLDVQQQVHRCGCAAFCDAPCDAIPGAAATASVPPIPSVPLGWFEWRDLPGGRVWWHNGETGGFSTWAGFQPATGLSIVVLSNRVQAHEGWVRALLGGR